MVRRDVILAPLVAVCVLIVAAGSAQAQSTAPGGMPPPAGMGLAQSAAMRFPQPVRTADLIGRDVLEPVESQNVLGRVRRIVRDGQDQILAVVDFGGFLGFGTRPIMVPVDAMVLVGQDMEIVAFTREQLQAFPTFSPVGVSDLPADTIIKVGLAKPSH